MATDFPHALPLPLRPLTQRRPVGSSLPLPLTSFVGREQEFAFVRGLLARPGVPDTPWVRSRLVTLTGPGGVGKTRLALRVAEAICGEFADGVSLVTLAPVHDSDLVAVAIAAALGVRATRERPLADALRDHLSRRELLLILDNFEHLLPAAPLIAELLASCPDVTALITSRAVLHVYGERDVPVLPLPLPDPAHLSSPDALAANDAVRLFVERAQAMQPDFALTAANGAPVARICRRLDGLPLAIELAAARAKVLPPAAMIVRLDHCLPLLVGGPQDQPTRLKSLRHAIAWSHDLLTEDEQVHFRRLAVFVGGFTLEAAGAVCGPQATDRGASPVPSVLDAIASLVDKSLLQREPNSDDDPRFGMLETVREFALERLRTADEETLVRDRHAAWCRNQLQTWWPILLAQAMPKDILARLAVERHNWRAALRWLDDRGEVAALLDVTGLLFWYWLYHSHSGEGLRWLERALAVGPNAPTAARVRVFLGAGVLALRQGDEAHAGALVRECLAVARTLGDAESLRLALLLGGVVAEDTGDYAGAEALLTEGLALSRASAARWETGHSLYHLGIVAWARGDGSKAVTLLEEARALHQGAGDAWSAADAQRYLGLIVTSLGEFARAATLLKDDLAVWVELGVKHEISSCLVNVAVLGATTGQTAEAARLFGAGCALREAIGSRFDPPERATYHRSIADTRRVLGDSAFTAAWEEGRALSSEQAADVAAALLERVAAMPAFQFRQTAAADLTRRETDVLRLLARRLSDKEIADTLSISPRTVMNHVASILDKLGLASRREVAEWFTGQNPD
jgi:non-specific serine/threonine protein kinase